MRRAEPVEISTGTPWPSLLHDRRRVPSTDVTDRERLPRLPAASHLVDRLGHRPSAEDRCPRWVGRGRDHQGPARRALHAAPRRVAVFRPVSLKRSFGSQQPELDSSQKACYRRTLRDRPARNAPVSPPAELPRPGGRCYSRVTTRSGPPRTPKSTAYLRHCDRLSIGTDVRRELLVGPRANPRARHQQVACENGRPTRNSRQVLIPDLQEPQ